MIAHEVQQRILIGILLMSFSIHAFSTADTCSTLPKPPPADADQPPIWDLSFIYAGGVGDPKVETDAAEAIAKAKEFKSKYEGKIVGQQLTAEGLLAAIQDLERLQNQATKPMVFLNAVVSTDQKNAHAKALQGKIEKATAEFSAVVTFFGLELARADETYITKLQSTGTLDRYREYIAQTRRDARYLLSKPEEELLSKLSPVLGAMADLREDFETALVFRFKGPEDPEPRDYTASELTAFMYHTDPNVRREAKELYLRKYYEFRQLFAHIYTDVIRQNLIIKEDLRSYPSVLQARNISNGLSDKAVQALLETTRRNFALAQRYWRSKAKLLGLAGPSQFTNTDVYAPYATAPERIPWSEGIGMVLAAYARLSPETAEIFRAQCLEKKLVHARTMKGKRGGAYMNPMTTETGPVWFMNWTGDLNSVKTAAHEGGHWLHSHYSREQTPFAYEVDMFRAETASTFAEALVTDLLLERHGRKDPQAQLGILVKIIDNWFATVYRQATFAMFEEDAFKEVRDRGAASADRLEELFVKNYGALFGDAVAMTPHFKSEWSYIPHFVNSPYYVYAYAAAELAAFAMVQKWRADPVHFGPKIIQFLRRGGSLSTTATYAEMGIDIEDPAFWQTGFDFIADKVAEVERLSATH